MEMPELGRKHAGIGVVFILIIAYALSQTGIASIIANGNMSMGSANCTVTLEVVGLKDGVPVTAPILNSPLYYQGVEIDALQFNLTITATGTDVDWTTLKTTFTISAEGYQASGLITWGVNTGDFTLQSDGSYMAHGSYVVDESLLDLQYTTPDETLADGSDVYYYNIVAEVSGEITDIKGGILVDTVTVEVDHELRTAPDGTFYLVGAGN